MEFTRLLTGTPRLSQKETPSLRPTSFRARFCYTSVSGKKVCYTGNRPKCISYSLLFFLTCQHLAYDLAGPRSKVPIPVCYLATAHSWSQSLSPGFLLHNDFHSFMSLTFSLQSPCSFVLSCFSSFKTGNSMDSFSSSRLRPHHLEQCPHSWHTPLINDACVHLII